MPIIMIVTEGVRKSRPEEDALVLVEFSDDLAQLLYGSINSVAAAAYSSNLIPADVKDDVADAKSAHNKQYISLILKEVRKRISSDPSKLKVFIDKVMKPIGPPVKNLTDRLSKFHIMHTCIARMIDCHFFISGKGLGGVSVKQTL